MVKQVLERDLREETEFLAKYDLNVRKITLTEESRHCEVSTSVIIKLRTNRSSYCEITDTLAGRVAGEVSLRWFAGACLPN